MSNSKQQLAEALRAALGENIESAEVAFNEVTLEVSDEQLLEVAVRLRDDA